MKFTHFNKNYLDYYNEHSGSSLKKLGILHYNSEYKINIFIPITSYKNLKHDRLKKHDSKFHVLINGEENMAVLKISDYAIIGKYSEEYVIKNNSLEQFEYEAIKRDKKVIERKIHDTLKNQKSMQVKMSLYKEYEKSNLERTRKFSEKYVNNIIYSITLFENLDITPDHIRRIIDLSDEKVELSGHDNRILQSSINAWEYVLGTLDKEINLEYIIKLNSIVAKYQSIKVGVVRDQVGGFVHGSDYEPQIPNAGDVQLKIEQYFVNSENRLQGAIEYFCYATKEQLFFDGNKRTSYLLVNKVLIANGIGVFVIDDTKKEQFNILLNTHYNSSHKDHVHQANFVEFIIDNCIIYE